MDLGHSQGAVGHGLLRGQVPEDVCTYSFWRCFVVNWGVGLKGRVDQFGILFWEGGGWALDGAFLCIQEMDAYTFEDRLAKSVCLGRVCLAGLGAGSGNVVFAASRRSRRVRRRECNYRAGGCARGLSLTAGKRGESTRGAGRQRRQGVTQRARRNAASEA